MPSFILDKSTPIPADLVRAVFGSAVEVYAEIPAEYAEYQYGPVETVFGLARASWWGEAREGGVPIREIPAGGLLLPGDPDLPSERRVAEAAAIAARLAADPALAAAVEEAKRG